MEHGRKQVSAFFREARLAVVPALAILGEVAFWGGGALLGAEVVARYRRWLNPRHRFPRDHLREKPDK